ncbi:hypothetical protein A2316_03450 [Candidatus Falkowbacteria bacterium RIFOXYB2_FULL_38_15]|uniref:Nudix hydrolase domain-containing protein n=1 Tax=Candidatus Falkowbacteria bacterium RIFOXYA2_FULL_38_12 TaxID=1797993 RepID=A0A1F5S3C7_9BACT|nr:MAG: hypothetical protein A2257_01775 [Candidatus Falkowbacteria bacterium RIFOXYA2_FULL_38_12]OGF32988.1 MAG: hypothetical protein A2316_03450 [Candidatus Falkowbacteria bacterium RIFOXYB2_FULL_38_15]OGF42644.1 MAG: hypothetical protein A2555_02490 [Candidatus Falkowbacteria bacterium RIFOXYD2_FULL_39_16]
MHKNPWWTYKHDKYFLPSGKEGDYYANISPGSIIIPILEDQNKTKIIMIKQFRYLFKDYSIEFPMGGKKESQTQEECALAELEEETGYKAKKIEFVGKFFPAMGFSKDVSNIYIARDLVKTKTNFDETEEIETLIKTPKEIDKMMENGEIINGEIIATWILVRNKIINK